MKNKDQTINTLADIHEYKGMFSDKQLYGSSHHGKKYANIEYTPLNNYQNFLYNRALFGLSVYSQDELKEMRWDKRRRIVKVHKRAQQVLNLWKQELVNEKISVFFETLFPKSRMLDDIIEPFTDPGFTNTMSFKDLRIRREDIMVKLIENGILPQDFYNLEPALDEISGTIADL